MSSAVELTAMRVGWGSVRRHALRAATLLCCNLCSAHLLLAEHSCTNAARGILVHGCSSSQVQSSG